MTDTARETFQIHRVLTPAGNPVDFEADELEKANALARSYAAGSREDTPEDSGAWTVYTLEARIVRTAEVRAE